MEEDRRAQASQRPCSAGLDHQRMARRDQAMTVRIGLIAADANDKRTAFFKPVGHGHIDLVPGRFLGAVKGLQNLAALAGDMRNLAHMPFKRVGRELVPGNEVLKVQKLSFRERISPKTS